MTEYEAYMDQLHRMQYCTDKNMQIMEKLGKQRDARIFQDEQLRESLAAIRSVLWYEAASRGEAKTGDFYDAALYGYVLGRIYGKREERAKRCRKE